MTRGDLIVIAAVAAAALLAVPITGLALSHDAATVQFTGPAGATTVSLDEPGRYEVDGAQGSVVFEVADGRVRAVCAECPDLICVESGAAAPGRPIVCAPNRVAATIGSRSAGDLDAVSR